VESIWDNSPHLDRLEDIFIKEGIDQQSFWKRQEQQEKQIASSLVWGKMTQRMRTQMKKRRMLQAVLMVCQ
jgi:hypothetical protein